MGYAANLINKLAKKFSLKKYLEIGVRDGETFLNVSMPYKVAVDPLFKFDVSKYSDDSSAFFTETSDVFFEKLNDRIVNKELFESYNERNFDIIYIDGLHTFDQSYKDFRNSIKFINKNSIIIMDDTLPRDPYSSIPNFEKSLFYRKMANVGDDPWHGDVFKTIFAIHDYHKLFSYTTNITTGYAKTIIWQTKKESSRKKIFPSLRNILSLSYFDMLDLASVLVPLEEEKAIEMIYKEIGRSIYYKSVDYSKIIFPLTFASYC